MSDAMSRNIIVGVTGASGAAYARRLIECLCEANVHAHCVITPNGRRLFVDELGEAELTPSYFSAAFPERVALHPYRDVGAPIGSGSFPTDGMIICPCSTNTLGAIASGIGDNLLNRAAAVTLKERRRLVVVLREMPLSMIDLENARRIAQAGGVIAPASPGFYMMPQTIDDLIDFVVGKLLDLVAVPHRLNTRWTDRLAEISTAARQLQP
jgi:flavin prenyltransferase